MIYTVTFNPSLDYIVSVDNFTCGIVNRTTDEIIFPGGKGINVSMVLKNLGFENTALGFLAGFTGNRIQDLLEEKGVRADFISVEKGISRINVPMKRRRSTDRDRRSRRQILKSFMKSSIHCQTVISSCLQEAFRMLCRVRCIWIL